MISNLLMVFSRFDFDFLFWKRYILEVDFKSERASVYAPKSKLPPAKLNIYLKMSTTFVVCWFGCVVGAPSPFFENFRKV